MNNQRRGTHGPLHDKPDPLVAAKTDQLRTKKEMDDYIRRLNTDWDLLGVLMENLKK